jgi:antitoxin ParD1/3/4
MATMNISLPDQMKAWAEAQAEDGRFANVSDYMRDLIRRDQARRQAIGEIQALVDEAMASGPVIPFDMDAFIAAQKAK